MLVLNDSGKYIIDENNQQQYFVGKATYVNAYNYISGGSPPYYTNAIFSIVSPSVPLVFVRMSSGYAAVQSIYDKGTYWQIALSIYLPVDLELYCFAKAEDATPSGTTGMKVFDSSGATIYDSRLDSLLLKGTGTQSHAATVAHGVSSLSKPAAMLRSLSFANAHTFEYGIEVSYLYLPIFKIDATNISGGWVYAGKASSGYPATSFTYPDITVPIIDGADYD